MPSLWVIRDRQTGHYWNGLGFTKYLHDAQFADKAIEEVATEGLPFAVDVLELRLIERESDAS